MQLVQCKTCSKTGALLATYLPWFVHNISTAVLQQCRSLQVTKIGWRCELLSVTDTVTTHGVGTEAIMICLVCADPGLGSQGVGSLRGSIALVMSACGRLEMLN